MTIGIVILAGGRGSRLGATIPKPLVPLQGIPMIQRIIDALPEKLPYHIVISPQNKAIFEDRLGHHPYLLQENPRGTADALNCQFDQLQHYQHIIVLNGDTPLIPKALITQLAHSPHDNILVGFKTENPEEYGQIECYNHVATKIIEAKDRQAPISDICFSGVMKISQDYRKKLIQIPPSPVTNEYYITSIVSPKTPFHLVIADKQKLQGVNTIKELQNCEASLKDITFSELLNHNITVDDHTSLILYRNQFKPFSHLGSQVTIKNSRIGKNCLISQGAVLNNVTVEENVTILPYSVLTNCHIKSGSTIGPFAHICEQSQIGPHAYIGNFVEVKRSLIKAHVKAKHLTYLGDAYIDEYANIGAGTITCNYVPWRKEKSLTYVGPYAFIGANTLLIAPIHIGPYALCAAGSVINRNLLPKSSALGRTPLSIRFRQSLSLT